MHLFPRLLLVFLGIDTREDFMEGEAFDQDLKRCSGIKQVMEGASRLRECFSF